VFDEWSCGDCQQVKMVHTLLIYEVWDKQWRIANYGMKVSKAKTSHERSEYAGLPRSVILL